MVNMSLDSVYLHQQDVTFRKDPKQAKKINSELSNSRTKYEGLMRLKHLLQQSDETIVGENISTWMRTLPQIILQAGDDNGYQHLAAENLKILLGQASQISSVSREVSGTLIPTVLTSFLQSELKNESILMAIEALLANYPTSCGVLRSKVVKYMIPLMLSSSDTFQTRATRCWARVPFLGGGGSQRSTHLQQWQTQFEQTIISLKYAFQIFMGADGEEILDPSIGSLSLPLPALPNTEPALSYSVIQRICTLCECLGALLNINFPYAVSIPIRNVILFILEVLDAVPGQMVKGNTSEMLHRASCLSLVQEKVLELFSKITKICKRNLCQYSSKINPMFSSMLDLWKEKNPIAGKTKKHCIIRTKTYKAISDWLQNCGPTSHFLCGPTHLNQSILKYIVEDITPTKNILKVSTVQTNNSKKAKKRRYAEATKDLLNGASSDRILDATANKEICTEALRVVHHAITIMGHRLSGNIHQTLQETIITTLLEIQQGINIVPYSRSSLPRSLLYKVLLALTMSPIPEVPPPVAIATKIFLMGLSKENSSEIRNYCCRAIASVSNVVHPWKSAWHTCPVINVENDTKNPNEIPMTIIEPINLQKVDTFDELSEKKSKNVHSVEDEQKSLASENEETILETAKPLDGVTDEPMDERTDTVEETEYILVDKNIPNAEIKSNKGTHTPTRDQFETEVGMGDYCLMENEVEADQIARNNSLWHKSADQDENMKQRSNIRETPETNPSDFQENKIVDDEKENEEVDKMLLDFVDDAPPDFKDD